MSVVHVSFHGGHSAEFCDHAEPGSTVESLISSYFDCGFRHVAITEHRPPHIDKFVYPDERALGHDATFLQDRFRRYFHEVRPALQEKWSERMHLFFGFETESYGQDPVAQTANLINQYAPDIIVASVHHVGDIPIDYSEEEFGRAVYELGGLEAVYTAYYDQQLVLIESLPALMSGRPVIIGHFDLIKIFSSDFPMTDDIWRLICRNIEAGVEGGCVFEVNARAFKKGLLEPYPSAAILQEIHRQGGEVTLGDDAHGDEQVGMNFDKVFPFVREGFDEVTTFEWNGNAIDKVRLSL